ncbi:MAG: alpha/beta hydrolase [Myxococcales bacterium]|nr:MAG: alpha/beta hydrolase [Myxococcales bacterium]
MGHLHIIRDFHSDAESLERTVRVYIPDAYAKDGETRFGVLYMFDGQNVFNHPESALWDTWCANTAMEKVSGEGRIPPWIVVGIDHLPNRLEEYSPWDDPAANLVGRGRALTDFILYQLKPFIDKTWRTRPERQWTAVMGSSMGGLMALYLAHAHSQVFGRAAGVSASLMKCGGRIFLEWRRKPALWTKLYLDVGTLEKYWYYDTFLDYVTVTQDFANQLWGLGYAAHELKVAVAEGHFHHEPAWQARLPGIMSWLLEETKGA